MNAKLVTKWKRSSEFTAGGKILATNWTCSFGDFLLQITNWPGTQTLDWEITLPGTDFRNGGSESRYDYGVSTLKEMVLRRAEKLNAR